jgi:hypothetical protein
MTAMSIVPVGGGGSSELYTQNLLYSEGVGKSFSDITTHRRHPLLGVEHNVALCVVVGATFTVLSRSSVVDQSKQLPISVGSRTLDTDEC